MKVLHIINSLIMGGAEVLVRDSILALHEKHPEIEQHVITIYEDGILYQSVKDIVKYKCLHATKLNFIFKARELRSYILSEKIDVVHAHLYDSMIMARLAVPSRVKFVNTYHTGMHNPSFIHFSQKRLWLDLLTRRRKQSSIFVSCSVKHDILKGIHIHENSDVLYNFPADGFRPIYHYNDSPKLKIASVGTLRMQKNHIFSLQAMTAVKDLDVELHIFGYGALEKEFQDFIDKTGINVTLVTNKAVTSEILADYDLFMMSSVHEGMSIALLEAMTTGLPSLLSSIPAFREIALDASFYFELDNPKNLSDMIRRIHGNKKVLKILSAKAIEYSKQYSIDNYLTKLLSIYHR
jgi:glycosyltransferase involved in cell wall biosynthesis